MAITILKCLLFGSVSWNVFKIRGYILIWLEIKPWLNWSELLCHLSQHVLNLQYNKDLISSHIILFSNKCFVVTTTNLNNLGTLTNIKKKWNRKINLFFLLLLKMLVNV